MISMELMGIRKEGYINSYNKTPLHITGCMCGFLVEIWMHDTCMWLFGICCHWHGDLRRLTVVSSLSCHFLDSHDIMGSLFVFFIGSRVPWRLWVGIESLEP